MAKKEEPPVPEFANVPKHVAIIMDGNGRWANDQGKPRTEGHRAGAKTVRQVAEACGFANTKRLCEVFRRAEGTTPESFRSERA